MSDKTETYIVVYEQGGVIQGHKVCHNRAEMERCVEDHSDDSGYATAYCLRITSQGPIEVE